MYWIETSGNLIFILMDKYVRFYFRMLKIYNNIRLKKKEIGETSISTRTHYNKQFLRRKSGSRAIYTFENTGHVTLVSFQAF